MIWNINNLLQIVFCWFWSEIRSAHVFVRFTLIPFRAIVKRVIKFLGSLMTSDFRMNSATYDLMIINNPQCPSASPTTWCLSSDYTVHFILTSLRMASPFIPTASFRAARAWFGMRLCVNRFECETTSNIGHKWARDAALSESHSYKAQGVPLLHGRKETNYRALTAGSIARRAGWKLSSGEKLSARRRSPASLWSLEDTSDLTDLRALTWTTSLTTHSISSVSLNY